MLVTMIGSSLGDSGTSDERAHIAGGYSYLTTGDYRVNPEHPPLIKDLAAFPLMFGHFKFPYRYWKNHLNSQWTLGHKFLYESGNNPDAILFLARLPIMLLSLLLGVFVFKWAKELFGEKAGIFALFLYVFDVNIIAHSRLVTTDLGISAALFIQLYYLRQFLEKRTRKAFILAGATMGIVLITKFSAGLLLPIYGLIFLLQLLAGKKAGVKSFVGMALLGVGFLYLFYAPHVINMSQATVQGSISQDLHTAPFKPMWMYRFAIFLVEMLRRLAHVPLMKPFAQYLLGFFMVSSHVSGGQNIYFMGKVAKGFKLYYPVLFLIKVPIPLLIFFAVSLYLLIRKTLEKKEIDFQKFYLLVPIVVFYLMAVVGNLDLGVRYLLPMFPFMFVFVSDLINRIDFSKVTVFAALGGALLIWYCVGSLMTYPNYLAYFNEFIGGPENGINYVADSNLDWGQDLKRLAETVKRKRIRKITVLYFGSGDVKYYLKNRGIAWDHLSTKPPKKGYFAISATLYTRIMAKHGDRYPWLEKLKPIDSVGHSILIFHVD
jgi:hypothetical protein